MKFSNYSVGIFSSRTHEQCNAVQIRAYGHSYLQPTRDAHFIVTIPEKKREEILWFRINALFLWENRRR